MGKSKLEFFAKITTSDGREIIKRVEEEIHDKVRKYKVNGNGTYSQILSAIKLIQQDSPKSEILVRINVSNRTLDSLTNIANELAEIKQNNNLKIMVGRFY